MSNSAKKWLIAAASLVTVGAVMFVAVMTAYHWDFSRLSTEHFETNTYEISEEFSNIKFNTETADIIFAASHDNMCRVVCYEEEKMMHSASVRDGTLTVSASDGRDWYEHIGFSFHSPKVTVYLPKTEYDSLVIKENTGNIEIPKELRLGSADISLSTGDVKLFAPVLESAVIKTSTGNVRITDVTAGSLDLTASTGEIFISDVTSAGNIKVSSSTGNVDMINVACQSFLSTGSTSDVCLKNVIAAKKLSVERSTGEIVFNGSDAGEIFVKTSTGDIIGSLLTQKVFIAETSTGNISVPKTASGGKCEITTSTGDIKIAISDGADE